MQTTNNCQQLRSVLSLHSAALNPTSNHAQLPHGGLTQLVTNGGPAQQLRVAQLLVLLLQTGM